MLNNVLKQYSFYFGCCCFIMSPANGQTFERNVIASAGSEFSNGNLSVNYTVGEVSVQSVVLAGNILTQGFQQPSANSISLPISWLTFTASLLNGSTLLKWSTAHEINNLYFEVQRSKDGSEFSNFLRLNSQRENNLQHDYSAIDPGPYSGNTYYRIRQVDNDGRFSFSGIVVVHVGKTAAQWRLASNPVRNTATFECSLTTDKVFTLELWDVQARKMKTKTWQVSAGTSILQWNLQQLPAGIYFIKSNVQTLPVLKMIKR